MATEKNHIDDYYLHINQETPHEEGTEVKKKIKLKPKAVSQEPLVVEEEKNTPEESKPSKLKIRLKQEIKVVKEEKKEEEVKEEVEEVSDSSSEEEREELQTISQPVYKKAETFLRDNDRKSKPSFVQKIEVLSRPQEKTESSDAEKKPFSFRQSDNVKTPFNKAKSPILKEKKWSDNDDGKAKKSKLNPFDAKRSKGKVAFWDDDDTTFRRSNKVHQKKKEEKKVEDIKQNLTSHTWEVVQIPDILTLKEFSEKIGIPLSQLIAEFMKNGMLVTINSKVDYDTASIIAEAFDVRIERLHDKDISVDDLLNKNIHNLLAEDDFSKLEKRPPVISIMGHVDHGKTSLLDYIRQAKVASGEAGWITQSIWAYQVNHKGQKITFLDTPGHEAFTVMRARGAKSTDIAILVVAADEWVKPQTIESISHAKEAQIPVIVAVNKMDKEGANPDLVKSQISEHGLVPEDWGGDVPFIPVSAKTGFGIDDLLEVILLVSEMKDMKANPNRLGIGTVIESHLDTNLWPVATVLVNTGIFQMGDNIVCNDSYGKIKILKDHTKKWIKIWNPWDPILIIWLSKVVEGGDIIQVVTDSETARKKAQEYAELISQVKTHSMTGLESIMSRIQSGNLKQLKVVVKADTNGSLEAIKGSLAKLSTEETQVQVIHSGVGNITEWDVIMCQSSNAILIWFRVSLWSNAKLILQDSWVEFISSEVIYHITERIEKIVTWMLDPKEVEVQLWRATVGGIFYNSKEFMVVGLKIKDTSTVESKAKIRVIRGEKFVGHADIMSLKQWVEEVQKFEGPGECGIKIKGSHQIEIWDILEIYKIETLNKR